LHPPARLFAVISRHLLTGRDAAASRERGAAASPGDRLHEDGRL